VGGVVEQSFLPEACASAPSGLSVVETRPRSVFVCVVPEQSAKPGEATDRPHPDWLAVGLFGSGTVTSVTRVQIANAIWLGVVLALAAAPVNATSPASASAAGCRLRA
jgi:hypothetical protein